MGKAAANKRKTTTSVDEVAELLEVQAAKTQFLAATMNLGWRLAITVVIPLVAGVKLDERFNSAPSLTLAGMFIAVAAGCAAVWGTIKEVNREQAEAATVPTPKERKNANVR